MIFASRCVPKALLEQSHPHIHHPQWEQTTTRLLFLFLVVSYCFVSHSGSGSVFPAGLALNRFHLPLLPLNSSLLPSHPAPSLLPSAHLLCLPHSVSFPACFHSLPAMQTLKVNLHKVFLLAGSTMTPQISCLCLFYNLLITKLFYDLGTPEVQIPIPASLHSLTC